MGNKEKKTVVLTGGAGFIGSCLLERLNRDGIENITVVDDIKNDAKWKNLSGKKFKDYIHKDEFLKLVCSDKITDAGHIVHLGACSSTTNPDGEYMLRNNYEYSRCLAQWAVSRGIPFLYASSAATYGNGSLGYDDSRETTLKLEPLNIYGFSKHLFDLWVILNGYENKVTGLKYFNVYGPNEYHKGEMRSVICKKFSEAAAKGFISLFKSGRDDYRDGEFKRDFIYVLDAVEATRFFFAHPEKTGIYNLGSGSARSWNDLARALFSALGKETRIKYIPIPENLKEHYQYFTEAKIVKLREAGFTRPFISLEDGIRDYVPYLKQNRRF